MTNPISITVDNQGLPEHNQTFVITYVQASSIGEFNSLIGQLESQVWYGNEDLAEQLSEQVALNLFSDNTWSTSSNRYKGPAFIYDIDTSETIHRKFVYYANTSAPQWDMPNNHFNLNSTPVNKILE